VFDVIQAIDACYAPHRDDRAWIDGVLATVEDLSGGRGVYAIAFTPGPGGGRFEVLAQRGPLPDVAASSAPINGLLDEHTYRVLYQPHPSVELLSRRGHGLQPATAAAVADVFRALGMPEVLGIFGGGPNLRGVLVGVVRSRPGDAPGARTVHLLRRLSAHLTSARRLRDATAGEPQTADDPATDAVLTVSGRVDHAIGAARAASSRAALSEAVRRMEWARGRARRVDPEEAARSWRGLVAGAWTLLDHVERDGRRYLLARRNPPDVENPRLLSAAERAVAGYAALGHSNKYVAYLLGIAPSTVAKRLARAQAKLGAPSRRVLIEMLRGG